ncbi:unnamed protein product [Leptidea sinapis]|uniref:Uncharacterized protein n=1 Tax=Leptidea sinapis TaxID=189913 RepID=A0A5E4QHX4_9NEOP|nr:unnamed protein product [Leptidea sinapis]
MTLRSVLVLLCMCTAPAACRSQRRSPHDLREYFRMPPLFEMDHYEECLAREPGLYCVLAADLTGAPGNDVIDLITEYSKSRLIRFNHSHIERGLCVTRTCKRHIQELSDVALLQECLNETIHDQYGVEATVTTVYYCHRSNISTEPQVDANDWLFGGLVFGIILLNVFGTLYDLQLSRSKTKITGNPYLLSFSIFQSWKRLTTNEFKDTRHKKFQGFHAIRAVAVFFTVLQHSLWIMGCGFMDNPRDFELNYDRPFFQTLFSGMTFVHIYYIISGCLLIHTLKIEAEQQPESWAMFPFALIYRLGRLLPAVTVLIWFTSTWFRHAGSGPLWSYYVGPVVSDCRRYWWSHLLFINNFVSNNIACGIQTWHVAAEVQMAIIALLLYLITRRRGRTAAFIGVLLVALVAPVLHVWLQDLEAILLLNPELYRTFVNAEMRGMHLFTQNNLLPFVVGVFLGDRIYHTPAAHIDGSPRTKILSILTWATIPAIALLYYFTGLYLFAEERASLPLRLLVAATHRPLVAVLFGFLLLSVVYKYDDTFSRIAEWSGWLVPSRLTFLVYIVHVDIVHYLLGIKTQLEHGSLFKNMTYHLGILVASFAMALPLYLVLEAPTTVFVNTCVSRLRHRYTKGKSS